MERAQRVAKKHLDMAKSIKEEPGSSSERPKVRPFMQTMSIEERITKAIEGPVIDLVRQE